MNIGELFSRLGKINGELLEGYTITKINIAPNKNFIRLTKDTKEIGVLASDDNSFTFYWEQENGSANDTVTVITGE